MGENGLNIIDMPISYETSTGERISQATIDRRYSKALKEKHNGNSRPICGCGEMATDNDHTVSRTRCKELHKVELIYDPDNFVSSCRECHAKWENWKSGEYWDLPNTEIRMVFLLKHDEESYKKRIYL